MPAETVQDRSNQRAGLPSGAPPGIRYAGIGDEAGPEPEVQLSALHRLGWTALELRTVHGRAVSDLDERSFDALAGQLAAARTEVVCVDSRIANWGRPVSGPFEQDLEELRALAPRCSALGTRYVRVMSYPDGGFAEEEWRRRVLARMTELAQVAEQHGLVLLHENCHGWAGTRAERMLELIGHVDSPALRLLFDIGNGVPHGYDAQELLSAVLGHVEHVHIKDAVRGEDGEVTYTLPGRGEAGVAECLTALLRSGWRGTWSIEPHTRLRPHDGTDTRAGDGADAFVEYGRALERLVAHEVVPALNRPAHGESRG